MVEAQLTDATLVFDGNVLELFEISPDGSARYLPEEEAAVQELMTAVAAARDTR